MTHLLSYVKDSARVLIDPAENLAPLSEAKGVPFYPAFFTSKTADDLLGKYGNAKVVVANNVFAHTDPIRDVFAGVATLIGDEGTFVFEVHWVKHLIEEGAFDQMYHEHLCFYSLHAAKHLVEATGMKVFDVEIVPAQGKSLRVYVAKDREASPRVAQILAEEAAAGLTGEASHHGFAETVRSTRQIARPACKAQNRAKNRRLWRAGQGNTLLNYYGLGTETLDYLTDTRRLSRALARACISDCRRRNFSPTRRIIYYCWRGTLKTRF